MVSDPNADFFNKKAITFGDSPKALDWSSSRTQKIRFRVLSEIGQLEGKRILDVGCGLADFYDFLRKNHINVEYTGIDVSEKLILLAKKKYPEINVRVSDVMTDMKLKRYDYVFGSGIHNLKLSDSKQRLKDILQRMFELCFIGAATNMLNIWYKEKNRIADHIYLADPIEIINYCRSITDYFLFRTDYLPNDFTLFLYRKDFMERSFEI